MKSLSSLLATALLSVLLGTWTQAAAAGAGKGANQRGGKASEHMSDKGALNNNSQWSADPERGWIRAEERHKIHDETHGTTDRIKKDNGKPKGKGKANKS
jgi:hypothetical protein